MSIIIDGTEIPSSGDIIYNGTHLTKIICDGVTVWEKETDRDLLKNPAQAWIIATSEHSCYQGDNKTDSHGWVNTNEFVTYIDTQHYIRYTGHTPQFTLYDRTSFQENGTTYVDVHRIDVTKYKAIRAKGTITFKHAPVNASSATSGIQIMDGLMVFIHGYVNMGDHNLSSSLQFYGGNEEIVAKTKQSWTPYYVDGVNVPCPDEEINGVMYHVLAGTYEVEYDISDLTGMQEITLSHFILGQDYDAYELTPWHIEIRTTEFKLIA